MRHLTRYRPLSGVFAFPRDLDRLMEETFGSWGRSEYRRGWLPATDASETPDAVTLRLEVPGLSREQLHISVENSTLTVRGERTQEISRGNETFRRTERWFGAFERSFALPPYVDGERVEASLRDGVLTITLPRREETKAREISIEGGSQEKRLDS